MADFGILQPLKGDTRVVAQIPQQANGLNQLAAGLNQGAQSVSNLQNAAMERANIKQQMDQRAQIFPYKLQDAKDVSAADNLKLQQLQQGAKDAKDARAAMLRGPDQYENWLKQNNLPAYQDYQMKKLDVQKKVYDVAKSKADSDAAIQKNFDTSMDNVAKMGRAASAGANPDMQQKIWQFGWSQLPPDLQKIVPQKFDQNTAQAFSQLSYEAHNQRMSDAIEKNPNDLQKNMFVRDQIQQRIDAKVKAGKQPDPQDVQDLNTINQAIQTNLKGKNKGGNGDDYFKGADNKRLGEIHDNNDALTSLNDQAENVRQILNEVPDTYTGPISGFFTGKFAEKGQILQKFLKAIPFNLRSVLHIPASEMRAGSVQTQLNAASGSLQMNKAALATVINYFQDSVSKGKYNNWKEENDMRQAHDPNYDTWLKNNPDPSKQTQETKPFISKEIPLGTTLKDKNGVSARYVGGDPKNPKSWLEVKQ